MNWYFFQIFDSVIVEGKCWVRSLSWRRSSSRKRRMLRSTRPSSSCTTASPSCYCWRAAFWSLYVSTLANTSTAFKTLRRSRREYSTLTVSYRPRSRCRDWHHRARATFPSTASVLTVKMMMSPTTPITSGCRSCCSAKRSCSTHRTICGRYGRTTKSAVSFKVTRCLHLLGQTSRGSIDDVEILWVIGMVFRISSSSWSTLPGMKLHIGRCYVSGGA